MPKTIFCPVCENDFELPKNELRKASIQRAKTGGKVLIGCQACARVLVVQDAPEEGVVEWAVKAETTDDWLSCIPLLDPEQAKIPAGYVGDLAYRRYRAGAGGSLLDRRAYMVAYGIDPLIHMSLNPGMVREAFDVGKR